MKSKRDGREADGGSSSGRRSPEPTKKKKRRRTTSKSNDDSEDGRQSKRRDIGADDQQQQQQPLQHNLQSREDEGGHKSTVIGFTHDEVVRHISAFLSVKSSSQRGEEVDSISYLANFLEAEAKSFHHSSDESKGGGITYSDEEGIGRGGVNITREDVATLLLPWSVSRLMRLAAASSPSNDGNDDDDDEGNDETATHDIADADCAMLAWRVLSSCMDILSSPNDKRGNVEDAKSSEPSTTTYCEGGGLLSSSLPQSTLSRLVYYAARTSFSPPLAPSYDGAAAATVQLQRQRHASNCFTHLTKRYHPTLDEACNVLLREVDGLVSSSTENNNDNIANIGGVFVLPSHQYNAPIATLQLVRSLMSHANPKRLFGTICSVGVLSRLGRLKTVVGSEEEDDSAAINPPTTAAATDMEDLIGDIIREGMFNTAHHMDGFRSVEEIRSMPPLPKLSTPSLGDDDNAMEEDVNDAIDETFKDEEEEEASKGEKTTKGKSRCFQSSLFTSIRRAFDSSAEEEGEEGGDSAAAIASILPMLTRGFFGRIRDAASQRMSGAAPANMVGGSTTTEADANLQFRFWCRVIFPALERLFHIRPKGEEDSTALALMEATCETLGLVLDYDAYSPSYTDQNEEHLGFLRFVTEGLLRCIDDVTDMGEDGGSNQGMQSLLVRSLHNLLSLNHRLLHESLARVVQFASSCLSPPPTTTSINEQSLEVCTKQEANALLTAIVRTYRELRQVGYFLSSARGAFDGVADGGRMNNLLRCGNIMDSLSIGYQSCPSGQISEIWDFFDGWIVDIVEAAAMATAELSFAVQMYTAFVKNVRANKTNSAELRNLCEKLMTTSICKMLDNGHSSNILDLDCEGNQTILMQWGFDLCGWLVDLHTRSCFWIDGIDAEGNESSFLLSQNDNDGAAGEDVNVLAYLRNVAKTIVSTEQFKTWKTSWLQAYWQSPTTRGSKLDISIPFRLRGSLQRLALHRIHQLHSMIYYSKLRENEQQHASDLQEEDNSFSSQALTNEARMLVDFSLYIACSQLTAQYSSDSNDDDTSDELSESLWSPLAQSLCIWTHYCGPFHAELFLIWFFSTLGEIHDDGALPSQVFRLEKSIVLTLERDASFYDVGEVMALFMKVGIQFASCRLLDSVQNTGKLSERVAQESSGLTGYCIKLAEKGDTKFSPDSNVIDAVSTTLSFLASVPLELSLCSENLKLLDRVVGLDVVSSQVIKQAMAERECIDPQLLNIVRSTKSIIANLLPKTLLCSSDFDASCLTNLVSQLTKNIYDFSSDEGVLFASSDVIGEYFALCLDYHEKEARLLEIFFYRMEPLVQNAADVHFISNSLLIKSVIRRVNIMDRRHSLSKKSSAYELCMDFVQHVYNRLQKIIYQHIAKAETGGTEHDSKTAATALLLESEILSFFGNHLGTTPETNLVSNEQMEGYTESVQKVFVVIERMKKHSRCNFEFTNASSYFLSSMSAASNYFLRCVSASSALHLILDSLASSYENGQETPLLEAALCSLIRTANLEQTKTITSHVLEERDGKRRHNPTFIVKIFFLLMTCANSREQHRYISGKCKTFLFLSMDLLRSRLWCERARFVSNVKLFSQTMITLTSKKELLLLGGREIAMIFCEMNPLFRRLDSRVGEGNDGDGGDVEIFKSCCAVVASLIAHYPKQLYGCPSPLFSLLLALLSDILRTSVRRGLPQKALEYAKVCELLIPHKDIFKKHAGGLILAYIRALNIGMNPTTKSKLMPSVYALLDMCSDFETRQINAMIDVPSKTLFAPVYQSYRKYYQYHGQA